MERYRKKKMPNINLRYNVLSTFVYVIGIILLIQLFNLQIINGATYRETSNTRLTRESTLYASRGYILDRNGNELATVEMTFALEMYKSKLDNKVLNDTALKIINTLESNGENSTPEEAFNYFKNRYDIENENIEEVRKILVIRYRITSEGYSATKSLTISSDISRNSALIFMEQSDRYPGVTVTQSSKRNYPNGALASHILGNINSISSEQYKENKDKGYLMTDIYGQTGIEYAFEPYLKGTNGIKQIS